MTIDPRVVAIAVLAVLFVALLIRASRRRSGAIEWRTPTDKELRTRKIYPFADDPLASRLDGRDGWIELVDSAGNKAMFHLSLEVLYGASREEAFNALYQIGDDRIGSFVDLVRQRIASFHEHYPKLIMQKGGGSDELEMGVEMIFDSFGQYMADRCPDLAGRSIIITAHATFRTMEYHQEELRLAAQAV